MAFATARLVVTVPEGDEAALLRVVREHLLKLPGFRLSETGASASHLPRALVVQVAAHGLLEELPDEVHHRIRSGRHRGRMIGEVPIEYASWLAAHGSDPADRAAAREWLRR